LLKPAPVQFVDQIQRRIIRPDTQHMCVLRTYQRRIDQQNG
jgi:hypothetical protein